MWRCADPDTAADELEEQLQSEQRRLYLRIQKHKQNQQHQEQEQEQIQELDQKQRQEQEQQTTTNENQTRSDIAIEHTCIPTLLIGFSTGGWLVQLLALRPRISLNKNALYIAVASPLEPIESAEAAAIDAYWSQPALDADASRLAALTRTFGSETRARRVVRGVGLWFRSRTSPQSIFRWAARAAHTDRLAWVLSDADPIAFPLALPPTALAFRVFPVRGVGHFDFFASRCFDQTRSAIDACLIQYDFPPSGVLRAPPTPLSFLKAIDKAKL